MGEKYYKQGNEGVKRRRRRAVEEAACGCVPDVTFCVMVLAAATHTTSLDHQGAYRSTAGMKGGRPRQDEAERRGRGQ